MGITFDREQHKFQFDFEHDGTSDLITLTGSGYQVEAFGKWHHQLIFALVGYNGKYTYREFDDDRETEY